MCDPFNMCDCWLPSCTGPHPELTVAAAVLVLLVIVIISLIVLVVIWKQVLLCAFGILSPRSSPAHLLTHFSFSVYILEMLL